VTCSSRVRPVRLHQEREQRVFAELETHLKMFVRSQRCSAAVLLEFCAGGGGLGLGLHRAERRGHGRLRQGLRRVAPVGARCGDVRVHDQSQDQYSRGHAGRCPTTSSGCHPLHADCQWRAVVSGLRPFAWRRETPTTSEVMP
jgi:hypothetical protein